MPNRLSVRLMRGGVLAIGTGIVCEAATWMVAGTMLGGGGLIAILGWVVAGVSAIGIVLLVAGGIRHSICED